MVHGNTDGRHGPPGDGSHADSSRDLERTRRNATFFRDLAAWTGLEIPLRTVEIVVGPTLPDVLESSDARPGMLRTLSSIGQALGLSLTRVRADLDEAIGLTQPGRPVLLAVRRETGIELVALHDDPNDTFVSVESLNGDDRRTLEVPLTEIAERLGLRDGRLAAAFRVETMAGEIEKTHTDFYGRPLARLWHFVAPDRAALLIVIGSALGLGVLTLATPIAVQSLVNFVAFGGLMQPLVVVGLLLLFFLSFAGAIRVFKLYVVEILQRRVFVRVSSMLAERLPRVRLEVHGREFGPELVNRFFDVLTVQKAGSSLLINGLDAFLQAGIGLLVLGFYHPLLLLFDVGLIAAIAFILFVLGRSGFRTARRESDAKYEVAGALEELARAPVTYKLVGAPEHARARLAELSGNYVAARRKHYRIVLRQNIGAVTLHAIAATSLLTLGGLLVIQGQLTLGQLVAAELIVSAALMSFVKFGKEIESYYDLLAGVEKLGVLFDLPLEEDDGEPYAPGETGAVLELRDVSYRHGTNGRASINGLSLVIQENERVAIYGPRGVGKSTLAELVAGLREPTSGAALFDGLDVHDIANASLRSQMDLIQDLEIVSGTVLDNIRLGRSDISAGDVRNALAQLGILDELLALPDGLRTELACSGAPLSRTTAQLLVLARCVAGRPRAIVIDSVLDELDRDSMQRALTVLTDADAPWTLLVLTSRYTVCELMHPDRLLELESGAELQPMATPTTVAVLEDDDAS